MPGVVAWGKRMYGKVDRVGNLLYVATPCSHFCFLPLIPHGSMVVTGRNGKTYQGVRIPLCWKSWMLGWIQALLTGMLVLLGVALAGLLSLYFGGDQVDYKNVRWEVIIFGAAFAVVAVLLIGTLYLPGVSRASYSRACELGGLAGLSEAQRQEIETIYARQKSG